MIRFGLGRRGTEAVPPDPAAWLAGQLDGPDPGLAARGHSAAEGLAAILRRIDWAYSVSSRAVALDPEEVAANSLGPLLPPATLDQIRLAGSRREAFSLLLASPEFLRR